VYLPDQDLKTITKYDLPFDASISANPECSHKTHNSDVCEAEAMGAWVYARFREANICERLMFGDCANLIEVSCSSLRERWRDLGGIRGTVWLI
jgi:hypothetical protein